MIDEQRGQTTLDFAIGASVFLLAVAFVVAFIPSMFEPFRGGDGALFIVADRTAGYLVEDALVYAVSEPAVLDAGCTIAFFSQSSGDDCRFEMDGEVGAVVGVHGSQPVDRSVNITVHELSTGPATPIETEDGEPLTGGDPDPPSDAVVSSRVVTIGDTSRIASESAEFRLTVRVW